MTDNWASELQAGLKTSADPVSAFFLIESSESIPRMVSKLAVLTPFGITPGNLADARETASRAWERHTKRPDPKVQFWVEFVTGASGDKRAGLFVVRDLPGQGVEVELILPGVIAASAHAFLGDGRNGFFCAFLPPSYYSSLG